MLYRLAKVVSFIIFLICLTRNLSGVMLLRKLVNTDQKRTNTKRRIVGMMSRLS
jgi:hypothetical protein